MKKRSFKKIGALALAGLGSLGLAGSGALTARSEAPVPAPDYRHSRYGEIWLAGGCFWGVQAFFDGMIGVEYTQAGYANGTSEQARYESLPQTGHAETVYVVYDPRLLPLPELLRRYFTIIEPTSLNRQGNDRGVQYRTGIYYRNPEDLPVIRAAWDQEQLRHEAPVATEVAPLAHFVPAEDYHQDYLLKNPGGYCHVDLSRIPGERPRVQPGRYRKPSAEAIREKLSALQYAVTQMSATEPPFQNSYWNQHDPGLYLDIVTGEPLFPSLHKFDSGSGWPSFTRPLEWDVVKYRADDSHGMQRVEVRSRTGDSHLGHLFPDGPKEEGGLRYCINSAALEFVPLKDFESRGLEAFLVLFPDASLSRDR